jgi:hypothetical protein
MCRSASNLIGAVTSARSPARQHAWPPGTVLLFELGVLDVGRRTSVAQQLQYELHGDAEPADRRPALTDSGIHANTVQHGSLPERSKIEQREGRGERGPRRGARQDSGSRRDRRAVAVARSHEMPDRQPAEPSPRCSRPVTAGPQGAPPGSGVDWEEPPMSSCHCPRKTRTGRSGWEHHQAGERPRQGDLPCKSR